MTSISARVGYLSMELDENDTLCNWISCGRRRSCLTCFANDNVRFAGCCTFVAIWQILRVFVQLDTWGVWKDSIEIIFLLNVILDCNGFVIGKAMKTFKVYYTTITIMISIVAFDISAGYWHISSSDGGLRLQQVESILSSVKNGLFVFSVCIMDGYNINKYLKALFCGFAIFESVYFHWYLANTNSLDEVGKLLGQPFHWQTLGVATITNVVAFMIVQFYLNIKYPTKLILIPTFVPFKFTNDSNDLNYNYNYNDSDKLDANNINLDLIERIENCDNAIKIAIAIDKKHSLLQIVIKLCKCNKMGKISQYMQSILSSKYVLLACMLFWTMSAAIDSLRLFGILPFDVNNSYVGAIELSLAVVIISLLIINLNLNGTIIKLILQTFTFWWKMQDAVLFVIAEAIYRYKVDLYNISSTISLSVLVFTDVCLYVFMIAGIRALIIGSSKFVKKLMSNGLIMVGIIQNLVIALYWFFLLDTDYEISLWKKSGLINSATLSTVTIMIEKKIDLSIFFMLQLYSNILNGAHGIDITGLVNIKWKKLNTKVRSSDGSAPNVELQAQLL